MDMGPRKPKQKPTGTSSSKTERSPRARSAPRSPTPALVSIGSLRPYPNNARTHSARQIREIARSFERFGFTNPILIDQGNQIIAGHGGARPALSLAISK